MAAFDDSWVGSQMVTLTLPREYVGQILSGLEVLIDEWDDTAEYLEHGQVRTHMMIRECHKLEEAVWIRSYYAAIKGLVEEQLQRAVERQGSHGRD